MIESLYFIISDNKYKLSRTYKENNKWYHDVKNLTSGKWKDKISDIDLKIMLKKYNAKFV